MKRPAKETKSPPSTTKIASGWQHASGHPVQHDRDVGGLGEGAELGLRMPPPDVGAGDERGALRLVQELRDGGYRVRIRGLAGVARDVVSSLGHLAGREENVD